MPLSSSASSPVLRTAPNASGTNFAVAEQVALGIIVALAGLTFLADLLTPRGFAVWVFYLLPMAISVWVRRPGLPLVLAATFTATIAVGFALSEAGPLPDWIARTNRVFIVIVLWATAGLCRALVLAAERERRASWVQAGEAAVSRELMEDRTLDEVGAALLRATAQHAGSPAAAMYLLDEGVLRRVASYAPQADEGDAAPERLRVGVPAQAVRDGRIVVLRDLPPGHLAIETALGRSAPRSVVVAPLRAGARTVGILELAFVRTVEDDAPEIELLREIADRIGTGLRTATMRAREQALLERTQSQAETLERQQGELRAYNAELESQSRALQASQARLETQQAELEQTNAELEAQSESLERERGALADAQVRLSDYASRLEAESRYKSEFLANMSHELRTPLNSALILAKLLSDNRAGRLGEEEVRWARTILSANNDLLALINDILDLAKIESGTVVVEPRPVSLAQDVLEPLRTAFEPVAAQRGLGFELRAAPGVPPTFVTDPLRLSQVLRNFLSNAFKFTEAGRVTLEVARDGDALAFAVEDTGIGIAREQQELVFEAFRQADGTTSRRFGGTGLGLAISRELARLLGGRISLDSEPGRGSRFTLRVPTEVPSAAADGHAAGPAATDPTPAMSARPAARDAAGVRPDRAVDPSAPAPGPRTAAAPAAAAGASRRILVVEDDPAFLDVVCGAVADAGFEPVRARNASDAARVLARGDVGAVLLDVGLPDESGLSLLERIKRDPATRHVPIHVISGADHRQTAFGLGAAGYALKPVARDELVDTLERLQQRMQRRMRRVLVVEDDARLRESIASLLSGDDVEVIVAATLAEAHALAESARPDCIVLDLVLPDGSGYDFLEQRAADGAFTSPPIIVYTGRPITADEEQRLRRYSSSIIVKGARSPERLLDEVTLFLHQVEAELPGAKRRMLEDARARDARFEGRTILLAEDDARNVFALASTLEPLGAKLVVARNGREAIEQLERHRDVDLVLMDVMMPELDGLAATRAIRARAEWARLPIVALTAKAMPEDRQACLDAGANDYLAKPIDVDRLVSLCRIWLPA